MAEIQGRKMRVAIIGCGDIAHKRYFAGLDRLRERAELAAVCDCSKDNADRELEDFNTKGKAQNAPACKAKVFTDCQEMLKEVELDGVFVATPHQAHADNVIACAEAGVNVHSEKPMATCFEEAEEMVRAVEEAGVRFLPLPFDYSPGYEAAREAIRAGAIGAVHAAMVVSGHSGPGHNAWFFKEESLGGAIIDMGVYGISQLLGIMGPVTRLNAFTGIRKPIRITDDTPEGVRAQVEDNAMISLDWGDGIFGVIHSSWVLPPNWDRSGAGIRIVGDCGTLHIGWPGNPVTIVPVEDDMIPAEAETWELGKYKGYYLDTTKHPEKDIVPHFIDMISGQDQCVGNPRQQVHVVELMSAAYTSATTGETVELQSMFTGFARDSKEARVPAHVKPATGIHGIGP